jgi:2-iminoacetate synthase ThiH
MLYARSDLKMAHLSLAAGVDDLEAHLHDGERTPKEMADSFDLNLEEMGRWLEEAGFDHALRNGIFEHQPEELSEA